MVVIGGILYIARGLGQILATDIRENQELIIKKIMNNRFILQKSETRPSGWVCTDTENGIVCVFDNKKFNETQKFTILEDIKKPDANQLAKVANEIATWLRENHYEKIMP